MFLKTLSRFFGFLVFHCFAYLYRGIGLRWLIASLRFAYPIASLRFAYPIASPLYCFASLSHYLYINFLSHWFLLCLEPFPFKLSFIYKGLQRFTPYFIPLLYLCPLRYC